MVSISRRRIARTACLVGLALAGWGSLGAQPVGVHTTPGTIARYGVPSGFQHQYDPAGDSIVLLEPGRTQIVLFSWAPGDQRAAITSLLAELGASQYSGQIRSTTIAGATGAEVRIDAGGGSKDWIAAVPRDGMLVGIWAKTAGDFPDLTAPVNGVLEPLGLAAPSRPAAFVGTYQTSSQSSPGLGGDGLFFDEYVTLAADGYAQRSSSLGGQVGAVGASGRSADAPIRWEVRGNRLLFFPEDDFINLAVQVFNNGLELYDGSGNRLLWVRQ